MDWQVESTKNLRRDRTTRFEDGIPPVDADHDHEDYLPSNPMGFEEQFLCHDDENSQQVDVDVYFRPPSAQITSSFGQFSVENFCEQIRSEAMDGLSSLSAEIDGIVFCSSHLRDSSRCPIEFTSSQAQIRGPESQHRAISKVHTRHTFRAYFPHNFKKSSQQLDIAMSWLMMRNDTGTVGDISMKLTLNGIDFNQESLRTSSVTFEKASNRAVSIRFFPREPLHHSTTLRGNETQRERRAQDVSPSGNEGGMTWSVTMIGAVAGGATAFLLALVLVIWVCRRQCSSKDDFRRPKEKLSSSDGKHISLKEHGSSGKGKKRSSGRGLFPVPNVVDVNDTEDNSLDDTTLDCRSVSKIKTPSTAASSHTFKSLNSPYGKFESPPRDVTTEIPPPPFSPVDNDRQDEPAHQEARQFQPREARQLFLNDEEPKRKVYVDVEKTSITSGEDDPDFDSPFEVKQTDVNLSNKFGTNGAFDVDYEDGIVFPSDYSNGNFAKQPSPGKMGNQQWGNGTFQPKNTWDESENGAWGGTAPERNRAELHNSKRNAQRVDFGSSPRDVSTQGDYRDNIELGIRDFGSPGLPSSPRTSKVTANGVGHVSGSGSLGSPRPGPSRVEVKKSTMLVEFLNQSEKDPDLTRIPDPDDVYLDEDESSGTEDETALAKSRRTTKQSTEAPRQTTVFPVTSPPVDGVPKPRSRPPSPSPSSISAAPSSSSGGVKKEGDYGPNKTRKRRPSTNSSVVDSVIDKLTSRNDQGTRSTAHHNGSIGGSNPYDDGYSLDSSISKPFHELTVASEAGVSSLGTRSVGRSELNIRSVTKAAANAAAAEKNVADAAKARLKLQQAIKQKDYRDVIDKRTNPLPPSQASKAQGAQNHVEASNVNTGASDSNYSDSEDSSSQGQNNEFLFDAVADTLGPRGVSADLESLSGVSHRSNRSKVTRSSSRRPSRTNRPSDLSVGSRSSRRVNRKSSEASVGSRQSRRVNPRNSDRSVGSRKHRMRSSSASVGSKGSRVSHMSSNNRSVAADLLRLEGQLSTMNRGRPDSGHLSTVDGGSVSGRSRSSKAPSTSSSTRRKRYSERSRIEIIAPPGKLGIILHNRPEQLGGTVVSDVRTTSLLHGQIFPGDRIVRVDDDDVSQMTVAEITSIMTRKADVHRTLTVIASKRTSSSPESEVAAMTN